MTRSSTTTFARALASITCCAWLLGPSTAVLAAPEAAASAASAAPVAVTLSVVATTDVHGHAESLPWLGGHLANLRARRATDGGGVVLVDAGDMFQGTLESNLGEGAIMVKGYAALGYTAVAIGNHEFDFGPAGPAHIPSQPGDDPRGALKARVAQASFPFLAANIEERGAPLAWPNLHRFTIVDVAGVRVGIIGVTTIGTPFSTHPRNFTGLTVRPLIESITRAAADARRAGAQIVIVAAHAGGECGRADKPDDLTSCKPNEEIFAVARGLPAGSVDMIAAGHTHQMVAHTVAGIPIVQAMSEGRAFGRVDLTIDRKSGKLAAAHVWPPRPLCGGGRVPSFAPNACRPPEYEGRPVRFDAKVASALAPDVAEAQQRRAARVGVTLSGTLRRDVRAESPLGNFAADVMRSVSPGADVAFINGGSLRSDLPAGPLIYGRLHEAFPFDDGLATVHLTVRQLESIVARNLERSAGILSLSGVSVRASCVDGQLDVALLGPEGVRWPARRSLVAITNGYLASGGDGLLTGIAEGAAPEATPMRERFAAWLGAHAAKAGPADPRWLRGGIIRADDRALFDARAPRLIYPGPRPVRCGAAAVPSAPAH
jgi:2',3'-cyclic-nucleotide 2'-phosphodiesterase (5'-nucleotidase family)